MTKADPGVVAHACNPSVWEGVVGKPQVRDTDSKKKMTKAESQEDSITYSGPHVN
jgi:hypothetical protein